MTSETAADQPNDADVPEWVLALEELRERALQRREKLKDRLFRASFQTSKKKR